LVAQDGVGALIMSPTRELAMQIFNVLNKIGCKSGLSAGLLIGGRSNVDEEKSRVGSVNILVCTPGRLLQHMDETYGFDLSTLRMLVLDEADRILDLGFETEVNAIVANLPGSATRQTMLFSATQTRSVAQLARVSLTDPERISVHEAAAHATPKSLEQFYMSVPLHSKHDVLYSFVRSHLKGKTLVFLSTCKQVRFVCAAFSRLRPGIPLLSLHGRMSQVRRLATVEDFVSRKDAVLFCTDVAARGLDFPGVAWVVQADCPER
jgi:ATP-dependent RNA helicase DDX10/DBP4